jgi:hypothetical protein
MGARTETCGKTYAAQNNVGRAEQIVAREPRERVSYEAFVD